MLLDLADRSGALLFLAFAGISAAVLVAVAKSVRRLGGCPDATASTAGALAFLLAVPLLGAAMRVVAESMGVVIGDPSGLSLNVVVLTVVAASIEELCRVFGVLAFRHRFHRLPGALWYGMGYGGAELLLIMASATALGLFLLAGVQIGASHVPSWPEVLLGGVERSAALVLQVAYSLVAVLAVAKGRYAYIAGLVLVHTAVNLAALWAKGAGLTVGAAFTLLLCAFAFTLAHLAWSRTPVPMRRT